jgi:hypothetical protein
MKTPEQILERYLSPASRDFFNAQRTVLMTLLPFKMAKPFLDPGYVEEAEKGSLPEDELWIEDIDPKEQLMKFFPEMHKIVGTEDTVSIIKGFLCIKTWIWVIDDQFFDHMELSFDESLLDNKDYILKKIADHYGYKPTIEDIEFEEIENDKN